MVKETWDERKLTKERHSILLALAPKPPRRQKKDQWGLQYPLGYNECVGDEVAAPASGVSNFWILASSSHFHVPGEWAGVGLRQGILAPSSSDLETVSDLGESVLG